MTQDLAKKQKCILMRSGIEIWIDEEKADAIESILLNLKESKFIIIEGRTFNTADISNILFPIDMEEQAHRKNGEFKCKYGNWHAKFEQCACGELERYNKV